jgi:transposase InsO family protein
VLDVLHEPRFVDQAPAEIYARLLDEKRYLCSERTMYRVLAENAEVRERREQLRHPAYKKPELLATAPNQVWSWDITKLLGPAKWTYFYLYVVLDIFSRYVVGWMIAHRESATLAKKLIEESCARQGITPGQLAIHADRGPSMTSKKIAHLYADLGVTQSDSRPNVSNDNPFSEAHFRRSSTGPIFPTASAPPNTAARTAALSSTGTTASIATAASACSRRTTSTTASPINVSRSELGCSLPRTPRIPSDSLPACPRRRQRPPPSGSTHPC